jgi:hypothetical protein
MRLSCCQLVALAAASACSSAGAWLQSQSQSHGFSRLGSLRSSRRNTNGNESKTNTEKSNTSKNAPVRGLQDYEAPYYPQPRAIDDSLKFFDLTGGRPGAIIETEEQLALKAIMLAEIDDGTRSFGPAQDLLLQDYGELQQDVESEYDIDDPDLLDAATIGTWTIQDLRSKFEYEWDPNSGEPDPNLVSMNQPGVRYVETNEIDDDGVEVGYDPVFGPSNPVDTRTQMGARDSYMISEDTANDEMLTPQFQAGDLEIEYNEQVVQFRKSLDIVESYVDPFLPADMEIPRHVARWHGYPDQMFFEPKNYTNNRFTDPDQRIDYDAMDPYRARKKAVQQARAKNAEWMPAKVSLEWHRAQRQPYEEYGTSVGTLRRGECDAQLVETIQPALAVLGSCVELLSIDQENSVYRFHYHGLMKNRHGMSCWAETLLRDCGVTVSGVVFETGFRRRDAPYDGGDPWYGPSN